MGDRRVHEALTIRWVIDGPDIPREELVDELTALAESYVGG
ncbi:hypothetical protein [Streptosporangium sp. NPDC051022]